MRHRTRTRRALRVVKAARACVRAIIANAPYAAAGTSPAKMGADKTSVAVEQYLQTQALQHITTLRPRCAINPDTSQFPEVAQVMEEERARKRKHAGEDALSAKAQKTSNIASGATLPVGCQRRVHTNAAPSRRSPQARALRQRSSQRQRRCER